MDFCSYFNQILPLYQDWERGIKGPIFTLSGKYPSRLRETVEGAGLTRHAQQARRMLVARAATKAVSITTHDANL